MIYAKKRKAGARSLAVTKRDSSTMRGGGPVAVKKLESSNLQITDMEDSSD